MIDGIKISLRNFNYEKLINHSLLDFVTDVNTNTGEIKPNKYGTIKKVTEYRGLIFILKENVNSWIF